MVDAERLKAAISISEEWLMSGEIMRPFPLRKYELDVSSRGSLVKIGFPADHGYECRTLTDFSLDGSSIMLDLSEQFGAGSEKLTLTRRVCSDELAESVADSRSKVAVEAANKFVKYLNREHYQIKFDPSRDRIALVIAGDKAAITDVTSSISPEEIIATALEKVKYLGGRYNQDLSIITDEKTGEDICRLLTLLKPQYQSKINILAEDSDRQLKKISVIGLGELLSQKPKRTGNSAYRRPSKTAAALISIDPENIDVVFSKNGETLRYKGLSFVRIRKLAGSEAVWLGVNNSKRTAADAVFVEAAKLISEISVHRSNANENNLHDHYKTSTEAWLEFELRKNITKLDGNLILSPLYGQFRASGDRIDLLALRSDGRLVIIEVKASADRQVVFQAADYWRKIETLRRKGVLKKANLFGNVEIADKPAIVYIVSPALELPYDMPDLMGMIIPEIEMWNFALHRNWRGEIDVLSRETY